MRGRYTLSVGAESLSTAFGLPPIGFRVKRHWNIAPGGIFLNLNRRAEFLQDTVGHIRFESQRFAHGPQYATSTHK